MQSDEKLLSTSQLQSNRVLKQAFSSLVDAMRFAYQKEQLESRVQEIESKSKKSLDNLTDLNGKIEALVQSLEDEISRDSLAELSTQISGFSHLAIEQTRAKV